MEGTVSHTATITTQVKDLEAMRAACVRLKLPMPELGKHQLFDGTVATGYAVKLPNWVYPAVVDVTTGKVSYDTFGERWGKQADLDGFIQRYAVIKSTMELRKKGYRVTETQQADGSIRLVAGGAY
jgi:hypothetical protein